MQKSVVTVKCSWELITGRVLQKLREAVIDGLTQSGVHVYDLGTVITPLFYHACVTKGVGAGIMVTASHNPPQYNGFKLFLGQLQQFLIITAMQKEQPTR